MNRIITVNIGGIAIQIEEDAYEVLRKYLQKIQSHFANTQNGSEINDDIEARVAEMLFEKLKDKPSINVEDVNSIIEIMGNPTDFEDEEVLEEEAEPKFEGKKTRSLFRDTENGILGGVSSGLAHYLNFEVAFIRAIWIALVLFFGTGVLFYIILWVIIPEAKTTADRLKMMGETPNVNNIKNTIRDEANKAYENIKSSDFGDKVKDIFEKIGELFLGFMGGIGRFIFAIISVILFVVFLAIIAHFLMGQGLFHVDIPWLNREKLYQVYNNGFMFWVTLTSLYLLILIPLARILIGVMRFAFGRNGSKDKSSHHPVRTGLRYLFLFSLVILLLSSAYTYSLFANSETRSETEELSFNSDTIQLKRMIYGKSTEGFKIDETSKLYIHLSNDNDFHMEIDRSSKGRNEDEASDLISEIQASHEVNQNSISFGKYIYLEEGSSYREQEVRYDLYVPEGAYLEIEDEMRPILRSAETVKGTSVYRLSGNTAVMTDEGLQCLTCKNSRRRDSYGSVNLEDEFDKISINEWVTATIVYGEENSVHMEGDESDLKELKARVKNGKLKIYSHNDHYVWNRFKDNVEIIITCKDLNYLESNGASNIRVEGFKDLDRLKIELNGATTLKTKDLTVETLDLEVNGAAKVNLKGAGNLLELESNGASTINSYQYNAQTVDLKIAGAASCYVQASELIKGNAAGVSKIRFKGDAKTDVDIDGLASMKDAN